MAKLTQRIRRSGAATGDNSGVPSGYTYLLQFIAHDMVDSVLTFNIHDPDITPGAVFPVTVVDVTARVLPSAGAVIVTGSIPGAPWVM